MAETYSANSAPVFAAMFDELGATGFFNDLLEWDENQCKIEPGRRAKALAINILDCRKPLYKVEEYYKNKDIPNLLGADINASDLNDDCLANFLDMFHEANPLKVVSHILLNAIEVENVEFNSLHNDTTSWSVCGDYGNEVINDKFPFVINKGYSKDHRPDLNQFKFGLGVTKNKFPVCAQVFSGSCDDNTWNKNLLSQIDKIMDIQYLKNLIYVADCKLVTKDNLKKIKEKNDELGINIKFISRFPGNFKLRDKLINRACNKEEKQWENVGKLAEDENASKYKLTSYLRKIENEQYRFIVVRSSQLKKKKEHSLKNKLDKQKQSIKNEIQDLEKKEFDSKKEAKKAFDDFIKENKNNFFPITTEIKEIEKKKKRNKPGPYPKDYVPEYKTIYKLKINIGSLNEDVFKKEVKRRSCFVLITSILDENECSNKEILKEYKCQTSVETSFKFIKDPSFVGPIYLEKPERVRAMAYLVVIAYLIYITIERRARLALASKEEPLTIAGNRETFNPTGEAIIETLDLSGLNIIYYPEDNKRELPDNVDIQTLTRILDLLDLDLEIYLSNKPYYAKKDYDSG
ncbi:MAG: IS1634 family transposase [Atribacterota bacterium]